jgi:hypothetical protein
VSIVNHPPSFTQGVSQSLTVCADATHAVNASLSVIDSDNAQLETWSLLAGPVHGTLVSSYGTFSTGTVITPAGLSYTPTAGYTGSDSFKVKVSDGIDADSITVYITDSACGTSAVKHIATSNTGIRVFPNPSDGELTFEIASPLDERVIVSITNLLGEKVKELITTTNKQDNISIEVPGVYFINAFSARDRWNYTITVSERSKH